MFKRILVPLDGSPRAERAIPVAARLARTSSGSVVLLRVVNTPVEFWPSLVSEPNMAQTIVDTDQASTKKYLAGVVPGEGECHLDLTCLVIVMEL